MESGNGGASSKGVLIPVPDSSDVFQNSILAPLQSAYLYEESKQFFRYKSAVLVKNPELEQKYNALREKRRETGSSEEDLKESYGFLLFDDVTKANALGETGVLAGNSTCTTLGDPSKGVYISMYSDCLDLNRWYHGKSGYIVIIKLTKGKVKKVLENYTQNFTAPTVGYDCHVSEQLPSVSAQTSSFLAFERTQYYMYELLDDGSNRTAQSPSAACPFAIVSFSYTDTKATPVAPQEKSEMTKLVCHFLPWRGQLQIGSQLYSVGLRSAAGALIPAQLPPLVKVEKVISMSDLRKLLPKAVFETCITGEAFLDGLYCSLCELVLSEAEETSSLAQLLWEIKEKDLALTVPLNDGGFLILLHYSHFLTYDDTGSGATDVLHGIFVFPDSRAIMRATKSGPRNPALSSEILRVLPVLSYAEGELEKAPIDSSEDLCEVLVQHMQSYAALINPGLAFSPSREVSIFPDQYDVPDAHKHLYSTPEWTDRSWQSLGLYLSKQASFQLPVSKASEILATGQEERREDLDDDVYICVSSPEEAPASPVSKGREDQLPEQKSPVNVGISADSGVSSAEAQVDLPAVPQNVAPDNLQAGDATKDNEKCNDLPVLNKTDVMGVENLLTPPASDDLPAELIVSITSAERSVTDKTLGVVSTVSPTKHSDFPFPGLLHTSETNSVSDETDKTVVHCPEDSNPTQTKLRKLRSGLSRGPETVSKSCVENPSLQTPGEKDDSNSQRDEHAKESSEHTQLSSAPYIDWRKLPRKRKFGRYSSKHKKVRSATVGLATAEETKSNLGHPAKESNILKEIEGFPLRKKTERWDLKAVVSECGRVLVPFGSVDAYKIKSLKDNLQSTKDEQCPEKMLLDAPVNAVDTSETEQTSSTAPETAVDETETTKSTDDGNSVQNDTVHHTNPEQSNLRQSDGGDPSVPLSPETKVHSSEKDDTVTSTSQAGQEKRTLSQGRSPAKGEFLFSKLKSVILRGKRKTNLPVTDDTTANTSQDSEPCLKKGKVDSNIEALNNEVTQSTNVGVEIVSKMLSVDPLFAYALGLTPKGTPDKVQKTENQDTQQRKDSAVVKEPTSSDKQPQIMHRPPSIFPRGSRIKTLKKHQGISAEYIKKKWWLHFQTPACFASEKHNNKDCTKDNSVRKTVKEKVNSACSSTDALTLLADLALSASNGQVPPGPNPALERKLDSSLKKSDLKKELSSSEQESVLHALLRQPAARSIQALESPSPSHLVGDSELVGLISKEHGYSLPPSSSLLLGLPGTPFQQVSPVSESTRLLHHHQTMCGDGTKTLHPFVGHEDRSKHNRTPEYLKKYMTPRRKFRYSRTFDNKEASVRVTRQWKENYDFSLDSKFTSDSKDKAIIRALHGPWDFSIQDTSEEVRLIVHMWIGLFYSRSTARFFHVDSNFTYPCSEDSDSLDIPSGMTSSPAKPELEANSSAASPTVTDTSDPLISTALDLSKKPNAVLDPEPVILDLSLRNANAKAVTADSQVNQKATSVSSEQKDAKAVIPDPQVNRKETSVSSEQKDAEAVIADPEVNRKETSVSSEQKDAKVVIADPQVSRKETSVSSEQKDAKAVIPDPQVNRKETSVSSEQKDAEAVIADPQVNRKETSVSSEQKDAKVVIADPQVSRKETSVSSEQKDAKVVIADPQVSRKETSVSSEQKDAKAVIADPEVSRKETCVSSEQKDAKVVIADPQVNRKQISVSSEQKDAKVVIADPQVNRKQISVSSEQKDAKVVIADPQVNQKATSVSSEQKDAKAVIADPQVSRKATSMSSEQKDAKVVIADPQVSRKATSMSSEQKDAKAVIADPEVNRKATSVSSEQKDAKVVIADPEVNRKATSVSSEQKEAVKSLTSLKPPVELHESSTFQCYRKMIHSSKMNSEVKDERSIHQSEKTCSPQKAVCLEHTDVPSLRDDGTMTPPRKETKSESVEPETVQTALGIGKVLHGSSKESTDVKDGTKSPETTQTTQKDGLGSFSSVTDKETDSNMDTDDVVHADESKDRENCEVKEDASHEGNADTSLEVIHTRDDSANKESNIVCNGHCSDNEEPLLKEKPKAVSPDRPENGNGDKDCEGKVMKDEDGLREEDGLVEKNSRISAVDADKDLSDQPLPVMSDESDLVNTDCITEGNHQEQLDEQPPLADSVQVVCHDSLLKMPCASDIALTDERAISEKASHTPSEMKPINNDPAAEKHSETALPMSDEGTSSLDGSSAGLSVPREKGSVEMENQNTEISHFSFALCCNAQGDHGSKSTEGEEKVENTSQKESFQHQSHLPQILKMCETEVDFTEEADLQIYKTNEGLDKSGSGVYIPFIGIATSGDEIMQSHDSHPQDKIQDVFSRQEKIPFICETTFPEAVVPSEVCSTPKIKVELPPCKLSIRNAGETNQLLISKSESDSRCPTPTMDEQPLGYIPFCTPSRSTSAVSGYETCKNITQKAPGRRSTPRNDAPPFTQYLCHTSTVKSDPNPHHDRHPDLELRTLRVLQSIDKFLSKSNLTGKSRPIKTVDIPESVDPTPNHNSKCIPTGQSLSHTSADFKNKKISNEKPATSNRQDPHAALSDCYHRPPFENALEAIHARLQLDKTESCNYFERPDKQESPAGQDYCHSHTSSPSTEQVMKPNIDQDRLKAATHEPRPYSQRPVMAVKPSKTEESQAGSSSKDVHIENAAKNKQTTTAVFEYASTISKLLETKRKATSRGNSKRLHDDKHETSESSQSTWQPNVSHSKPNSVEVKFAYLDPSHQHQGRDVSKFTAIPSSSLASAKTSPKLVEVNQGFFTYSSAEKVDRATKKKIEMHQIDFSDPSASFMGPKNNSIIDDSLALGPESSLVCTVFNTSQKESSTFLEQLSQRCLQDDLTRTSVEQECLIFSEKMKQLLKKSNKEAVCQQDTHDSLRVSCTSPVTVHFSSLEEEDDFLDHLDTSIVGQKIKVDMSDRNDLPDTMEEERTLHPGELPQGTSNPMESAWVSGITAECARQYEATMQDICAVDKVQSKPKGCRMDRDKTEPSNHFDFCNQMKREMDEAFRSSLNSVVKKSCKTKYRFYILVTSDDVFFEETKAHLEAEGHIAVQPSEFFLCEESSSSLLIILRNEDIAEHICEVPRLLELKKSQGVMFAGIDEPDDVVNLTHQELFTRGGFIMFDRATLEHLSLCNMKKLSEVLQELSSTGKWKWMLHYRDSRRLKENARLSAEAKEKKDFLNWGQDTGILEVLPYHECDLMSRDQPDYLTCLVRLQVQNISSRYPVFITDTTTDSAFERNGILTVTLNSFLTKSPSETFAV